MVTKITADDSVRLDLDDEADAVEVKLPTGETVWVNANGLVEIESKNGNYTTDADMLALLKKEKKKEKKNSSLPLPTYPTFHYNY